MISEPVEAEDCSTARNLMQHALRGRQNAHNA